jgi:MATE family multidrug resistance protein
MFSYNQILKIVVPLIISGFGQSIIYVTDILFLGRLGEVSLGASAIAGLFYASLMMIGFGISSGLQVIIAQKTGEGKGQETHLFLLNGIFLQLLTALAFTSLYFVFDFLLLQLFVSDSKIRDATNSFLNVRIIGLLPYFLFYAYRSYYLGIGSTKIISVATILMSALNLILNPILIYGWKGYFNGLGLVGSAWASVISELLSTGLIMFYYSFHRNSMKFISKIKKEILKDIMKVSLPLIFQHFISVFSWFLFFVFIEKMGSKELAVSNVIRAVYILVMAPILAFSHSTVTIIGQIFGSKKYAYLKPTLLKIIILSVVFTFPFFVLSYFQPFWLMQIFTNDEGLLIQGEPVMKVISLALLYFSISMPLLSAVTGLGDTQKALLIESISFVVYILASAILVFVLKLSLPLVWCNEFVYFTSISFLSYYFFQKRIKRL